MPAIPVTAERSITVAATFMDYSGARRSTSYKIRDTGTVVSYDAYIAAFSSLMGSLGESSNAALISARFTIELGVQPPCDDVVVYDEAYASVDRVANMAWRDGLGKTNYIAIPAIDVSKLTSDRRSLNTGDARISNIIAQMDILNDASLAANFDPCYIRSFLVSKAQRFSKFPYLPGIAEPGLLDQPPQAPALEP